MDEMLKVNNLSVEYKEFTLHPISFTMKKGEILSEVYKDYQDKITYGSFTNVWTYQNWKNIIV